MKRHCRRSKRRMSITLTGEGWRSLPHSLQVLLRVPFALDPPRGSGVDERPDYFSRTLGVLAWSSSASDDVKGTLIFAVGADILVDGSDDVRVWNITRRPLVFLGYYTAPS